MYDPDCSGAVQRKGVVLLREVHSQLLDVAETGAATPVPPVGVGDNLPGVGDSRTEKNVKLEPNSEDKKLRKEKGIAPVVDASEEKESSPSPEKKEEEPSGSANKEADLKDTEIVHKETDTKERSPGKVEKEKKSSRKDSEGRERRRRSRRETEGGADTRSRSRHRRRRRRSSRPDSPKEGAGGSHSPPGATRKEGEEVRVEPRADSRSPVPRAPRAPLPSRPSGLTNAQKRAIPPPPKPPPVKPTPREPDHPPPGYSSWAETDVRAKSQGYRDYPPNKGKKKDERNTNFRLSREYERGYW